MKKVLILDDNPLNNKKYIEKVELNYHVDTVLRLVSAKRLIQSRDYDFVVIDVMMPTEKYDIDDETTTGFVFYQKEVEGKLKNEHAQIVFWSRLEKDGFDGFWGDNPPNNTHFLHKTQDAEHLLNYIKDLDK